MIFALFYIFGLNTLGVEYGLGGTVLGGNGCGG